MAGVDKKARKTGKRLCADILRGIVTQDPEHIRLGMLAMLKKWGTGDVAAGIFIRDCIDGKPHQSIDMDVDMSIEDNSQTASDAEVLNALRNRILGILPKRNSTSVEGAGSAGTEGEKKLN